MALIVEPYQRGKWAIRSTHFSKALRATCRRVPGMEYDGEMWVGYVDAVSLTVKLLKEQSLRLQGDELLPKPQEDSSPILTVPVAYSDLREYQKAGVIFLVSHAETGVLLADDLGLGKSAQAVRAARAFKGVTLVVCPSFARSVWTGPEGQIAKWWPGSLGNSEGPLVLQGTRPEKTCIGEAIAAGVTPPLMVCHYDVLHAWAALLAGKVETVIFDEARFLQSETSRRSKAARLIAERARYRIALDGTPMSNRTRELWNVLDILSPGRFGKPFAFYLRYCDAHRVQVTPTKVVWEFDGSSNVEELNGRLQYMMLRRTKSDVGMELPPLTRQIVELELEDRFSMGADVALRSDVSLRKALNLAADGKLPQIIETLDQHLAQGRKIVAFTYRQKICEAVATGVASKSVGFIHGLVPQKKRDAIIASKPDLLVCNMDCVAGGIDLSYYDEDVFVEIDYNPQKILQCSGRVNRFGQKKRVLEIFFIGRGTVDELIRDRDVKKLALFEKAVGKSDDKLREALEKDARTQGAADLRRFWESIQVAQ